MAKKVLLTGKNMAGESEAAWRALLDNLVKSGLKTPKIVIAYGNGRCRALTIRICVNINIAGNPEQRCGYE